MRNVFAKASCVFAGLALAFSAGAIVLRPAHGQQSQSAAMTRPPRPVAEFFPTLPISQWVGQKVQFLAKPVRVSGDHDIMGIESFDWMRVKTNAEIEKETYRHGDVVEFAEVTPITSAPDYVKSMHEALDGKVATIVSIKTIQDGAETEKIVTVEVDQTKRRYAAVAYSDTVGNVVFLREREAARHLFTGKTLHCQEQSLLAFRGQKIVRVPIARFAPAIVEGVVASTDESAPLRFLLRTRDGRHLFADVHLSGTNIRASLLPYGNFAAAFAVTAPPKHRAVSGDAPITERR